MKYLLKIIFFLLFVLLFSIKTEAQITLNISADNNSICMGATVVLTVEASGGVEPYDFSWSPSEFLLTNNVEIVKGVPNETMTFSITVTDSNLETKSGDIEIIVHPKPIANFTPSDGSTVCDGIVFTDASTGSNNSFKWTFGTDAPVTVSNSEVYHIFNINATTDFDVELITFSENSCTDTITNTLTVKPKPTAIYNIDATECNGILFSDESEVTESTISNIEWDFDDGTQSTASEIYHLYDIPEDSPFDVELIAYASNSCSDTVNHIVTVYPKPIANFTPSDGSTVCDGIVFTDASTISSGINNSFKWTFGTDAPLTVSNTEVYHIFNTNTTTDFDIELITFSENSCTDTITNTLTVKPKPTAIYNIDATECNGILFSDESEVTESTISNIEWDFDDGSQNTASEIYHLYDIPEDSPFDVELIAYASNSCSDTVNHIVTVYPKPIANFTPSDGSTVCDGIVFTDASTISSGINNSFKWTFGTDAPIAVSNTEVYHIFNTTTTTDFNVELITFSENSCTDTITNTLTVKPKPTAIYNIDATECNGILFSDESEVTESTISNVEWDFGDGTQSTASEIYHLYATPENSPFDVELIAYASNGCSDTVNHSVTVYPKPIANFTPADGSTVCDGIVFTDVSTYSNNNFKWTFGINPPITVSNTEVYHIFNTTTTTDFNVELITFSENNCSDTINHSITVNPKPIANFTPADGSTVCDGIVFTDVSTISSGTNDSFEWTFGNDAPITVSNTEIYHIFNTSTTTNFNVELVTFSNNNCTDTITNTITVKPKPTAIFNIDATECNGILFSDESEVGEVTILNVEWDFGDGTQSTASEIYHLYATPENSPFDVELITWASNGCSDTVNHIVTVFPKPTANFTPIDGSTFCDGIVFTDASTISSGSNYSFKWTFGTNAPITVSNTDVYHIFNTNTTTNFDIELITFSENSCTDTITNTLTVKPKPTAIFNIDATECNGILFLDESEVGEVTILNVEWDFDDGTQSTASEIYHLYNTPEDSPFDIELIAYASNDCSDTVNRNVTVFPKPIANFTPTDGSTVCDGIVFTDASTISSGSNYSFKWIFATDAPITVSNTEVYHIFNNNITTDFDIELITFSENSCTDTITNTITVKPKPTAIFNIDATECNGILFLDESEVGEVTILNVEWDFDDGTQSTASEIYHLYDIIENSSFDVELIAYASNGCSDTVNHSVTVYPKPIVNIGTDSQICNGTIFTDASTITSGTLDSRQWTFDDGDEIITENVDIYHFYQITGNTNFNVQLITFSDNNCSDTIIQTTTIYPKPIADFFVEISCFKSETQFVDNSEIAGASTGAQINYINWEFGDGNSVENITSDTTYYKYNTPGTYDVQMIVFTNYFCTDTVIENTIVNPLPTPHISGNSIVCSNSYDEIYTTLLNANNSYYWFKDSECEINNYQNKDNETIVHWQTVEQNEKVHLFVVEIIEETGCLDTASIEVEILQEKAPDKAEIIFKADDPETNILVCLDFEVTEWQWGYNDITLTDTIANWHFWDIPHKYEHENNYWSETSFGNTILDQNNEQKHCTTLSYFNDSKYFLQDNETEEFITLYPNPTSNYVFIEMNNELLGNLHITVNDMIGKTVYSILEKKQDNDHLIEINTENLNAGLYFVKIVLNDKKYNLKFLKN